MAMRDVMPCKRAGRTWWKYFPSCIMGSSLFIGFGAFCLWFQGEDDGLAQTIGTISGVVLVLGGAADLICDRALYAKGLTLRSQSFSNHRPLTSTSTINLSPLLSSGHIYGDNSSQCQETNPRK
eukprot:scaffold869_cov160-Ochromonas_danica.AAC.21